MNTTACSLQHAAALPRQWSPLTEATRRAEVTFTAPCPTCGCPCTWVSAVVHGDDQQRPVTVPIGACTHGDAA